MEKTVDVIYFNDIFILQNTYVNVILRSKNIALIKNYPKLLKFRNAVCLKYLNSYNPYKFVIRHC